MSVILDALRKAQNERKRVTSAVVGKFSEPSRRPRWIVYAVIAGAVVVGSALFVVPSVYRQKPNIVVVREKSTQASVPAVEPYSKPAAVSEQRALAVGAPLTDTGAVVKAVAAGKEKGGGNTGKGNAGPDRGMRVAANAQSGRKAGSHNERAALVPPRTEPAGKSAAPDGNDVQVEVQRADQTGTATMFNKALVEAEKGNTGEAKRLYQAVLAERPNHIESINNLGVMAIKEGNDKEALFYFKRTLEADKQYGKAYNNIGLLLLKQGNKQRAAAYFRRSIENGKSGVEPYLNLAALLRSEKKPGEASQLLETLLKRGETDPAVHLSYAILKDELGQPAEAIVHYRYYLREAGSAAGTKPVMERLKTLESDYPRSDR
jgi:Tfp pilus assembly protein PilF